MNTDQIKNTIQSRLELCPKGSTKRKAELTALLVAVEALKTERDYHECHGRLTSIARVGKAISTISDILEGKQE